MDWRRGDVETVGHQPHGQAPANLEWTLDRPLGRVKSAVTEFALPDSRYDSARPVARRFSAAASSRG
jgi:hypothetical protein